MDIWDGMVAISAVFLFLMATMMATNDGDWQIIDEVGGAIDKTSCYGRMIRCCKKGSITREVARQRAKNGFSWDSKAVS